MRALRFSMTRHVAIACGLLTCFFDSGLDAQDWTQFHGPNQNRRVTGSVEWKADAEGGAPVVWRVDTKRGFSSIIVVGKRAFTLVQKDGGEACVSLDVKTGKEVWSTPLGKVRYDGGGNAGASDNKGGDGPRSTPSHDGKFLYVFDAQLVLHCLRAKNGKRVWKRDLIEDYGGRNIRWQNAQCPLVEGDAVFVAGGGPGESLLAFDKKTGKVLWKKYDEKMTHATPVAATIHGKRQVLFYVQSGLIAVDPKSGDELWRADYRYRISSAASPVVADNMVYVSAGYGVGAGAFEIVKSEDSDAQTPFEAKLLWYKPNKLMNHWSTPVAKDGHLYGMFSFKKYGTGPLKCVEMRTGETKWSIDGFGPGNCILVGDVIVALSDRGEVVLATAKPDEYEELARADVLRGKCWSTPTYADGQIYARSTVEAVRLDVSGKRGSR